MDKKAWFTGTIRDFQGPLIRYTRKITRDVEEAQEIVQESYLKLWKQPYPQIVDRIPPWLYLVCRNHAIDRKRREEKVSLSDSGMDHYQASGMSLDDQVVLNETFRLLSTLKESECECLVLKFQEGLSYKEIAEVTGLSVSNVGLMIHQGMKTLRAHFSTKQEVEDE